MATILVVDDLSANRNVLVAVLAHAGHTLLQARDGSAGLAVVRDAHPDLVITDVLMPVMDGYEFVRQLRLDPATSATPVVFHTAHYGEREARALALAGGVSDVLLKPAQADEVLGIVDRMLSTSPVLAVDPSVLSVAFDREHLRLLTDQLSEKVDDLRTSNARLRALINIGLELASERDGDRLLQRVCTAVRDLFAATSVTLGILDSHDHTVQRFVTSGADDVPTWIKTGDAVSGVLGTVVGERRVVRGDSPSGGAPDSHFPMLHPEAHGFLAAPVASPTHVYGWMCLVGTDGRTFTDNEEQLVMALSGLVGRIYESACFSAVAQHRADALEREIVERKQAELGARLAGDRAQRYLDTAEIILLALDLNGRITLVNRYACDILGWTLEELQGRDWVETCLPERMRAAARATFGRLVAGDLAVVEGAVLTRSGEERVIAWRNTLLRDEDRVIGTFSSGADVTGRVDAIEALRKAEERMRFALEAAAVGIWDIDFTTGTLQLSGILEAQFGVPPGTFGGTLDALMERVHPLDRDMMREAMNEANLTGHDFAVQHRALWPDGTVRWLSGLGRVRLGQNGEAIRGIGISLDITERRTLEAQYQQAQKMEAIGQLAGGVAHDFNNLLTIILGNCELVLSGFDAGDPRQRDVAEIQTAGLRAAGLTRQLLAFSRKQIIEPTRLNLNVVVTEMQPMLARLIREDVTIAVALGDDVAALIGDRGEMEQIIMNLAVNARDAMPVGGTLTIETANVELDDRYAKSRPDVVPGPYIVLKVSDTGTGMSPEVQAHLFEPFFTTKAVGQGTGLGLATVHGIVARNGGNISVHSEVGRGTSFTVYFPKAEGPDVVAAPPVRVARPRSGAETILVVEDADGVRELTKRVLERQGYTVVVAASADDAMRLVGTNGTIDLLLTDVVMPGASGSELTRQLLERRPTLKVVYMSGYPDEAIAQHGILNAGVAFVQKPFTADTLGRKIRDVLDR
ncbi:MAG: multi-sensor hybrid histidine kinase [Acidobacteria bacterium]|nr:multi-sensor hybrid histidine kinase [Acidobacteriota bacterium]